MSFQIIKLQKGKTSVELICKPGMITKFRNGKCSIQDALVDDRVYSNASKGEVAPDSDISVFGASAKELIELIMKTGKYSLTAQEKREMVEQKRLEVINFIHSNFVNSVDGYPHPVTRIESALSEIKAQYDPDVSTERQARALIPKLQTVIRLAEQTIDGQVIIPNNKLGQCVGIVYNFCNIRKEEYGPENAYFTVTISPGKFDDFNEQISRASQGQATFKIAGACCMQSEGAEKEVTHARKKPAKGNRNKH